VRGTDFIFENERIKTAFNATSATPTLPKHQSSLNSVAGTFAHLKGDGAPCINFTIDHTVSQNPTHVRAPRNDTSALNFPQQGASVRTIGKIVRAPTKTTRIPEAVETRPHIVTKITALTNNEHIGHSRHLPIDPIAI